MKFKIVSKNSQGSIVANLEHIGENPAMTGELRLSHADGLDLGDVLTLEKADDTPKKKKAAKKAAKKADE